MTGLSGIAPVIAVHRVTKRRRSFALALTIAFGGLAHAAPACRVGDAEAARAGGFAAAVAVALRAAPDCDRAFSTLQECQLGSRADNELSELVVDKCEPEFKPRAGAALLNAYAKARNRCEKLARDNPGSLYQSFAAICLGRVARDFSHIGSAEKRAYSRRRGRASRLDGAAHQ